MKKLSIFIFIIACVIFIVGYFYLNKQQKSIEIQTNNNVTSIINISKNVSTGNITNTSKIFNITYRKSNLIFLENTKMRKRLRDLNTNCILWIYKSINFYSLELPKQLSYFSEIIKNETENMKHVILLHDPNTDLYKLFLYDKKTYWLITIMCDKREKINYYLIIKDYLWNLTK